MRDIFTFCTVRIVQEGEGASVDPEAVVGLVDVLDQALGEVAFHQREDHSFVSSAVGVACYRMEDLALVEVDHGLMEED